MENLLVDTNVLIYETFEDSEHHVDATDIVYSSGNLLIPSIVIHEYIWLLTRRFRIPFLKVSEKVEQLLSQEHIRLVCEEPSDLAGALRLAHEDDIEARELNDYIILSTALRARLAIASYDNELRQAATRRGVKVIPASR